jgi:hypothetical protein
VPFSTLLQLKPRPTGKRIRLCAIDHHSPQSITSCHNEERISDFVFIYIKRLLSFRGTSMSQPRRVTLSGFNSIITHHVTLAPWVSPCLCKDSLRLSYLANGKRGRKSKSSPSEPEEDSAETVSRGQKRKSAELKAPEPTNQDDADRQCSQASECLGDAGQQNTDF